MTSDEKLTEHKSNNDAEAAVKKIISSFIGNDIATSITSESNLRYDLGFDSLKMLELCVEVENQFKISTEKSIGNIKTVGDIISFVENSDSQNSYEAYDINDYPLLRTKKHIRWLKRLIHLSKRLWNFEVSGLENIPVGERYILCPNHQSHLDSLWIWAAIGTKYVDVTKICCLAKQEHLDSKISVFGLTLLGGIPVDRSGNSAVAMKRGLDCIKNGYVMLIHPEGTRTKSGKIQKFKGGAAKLAIDAQALIVPVCITGAWDIYPPHKKIPKFSCFRKRHTIKIFFGKPIVSEDKSVEDLTTQTYNEVRWLGKML